MASVIAQAGGVVMRDLRQELRITGLPVTATHADVWRLVRRHQIRGANRVLLHYNRFRPTGTAYVAMVDTESAMAAVRALHAPFLASFPLSVRAHNIELAAPRGRGAKGREEALHRGLLSGSGPDAGIAERGLSVVVSGLPGEWFYRDVRDVLLPGFDLLRSGDATIVNLATASGKEHLSISRWLVRFATASESHRFVRKVHKTVLSLEKDYQIDAHIVH